MTKEQEDSIEILENTELDINTIYAEQLAGLTIFDINKDELLILGNKEEIKQYFKNKAKENPH